ncbi:MAG: PEP-CTERM sorting domain-containing protein [Bryobacteraceae bacterium]
MNKRLFAILPAMLAMAQWPAAAGPFQFHDWTSSFSNSTWNFSNTSSAGTITGSDPYPGFLGFTPGTLFGLPAAITSQSMTTELQIHGIDGLGSSIEFDFSAGYGWGAGGQLIIGNIHNHYAYTIEAWDFANNPIDVNTWTFEHEYFSGEPGIAGYFSTSPTSITASGNASVFSVSDLTASDSGGQGGLVLLSGLVDVGRIRLTLSDSALQPNPQQVDFILFNVGTPVPEPSTLLFTGVGVTLMLVRLRRRR